MTAGKTCPAPDAPVTSLRGIGAATAALMEKLSIRTVGDLLRCWPRQYEDRTVMTEIARLEDGQTVCVRAVIASAPQLVRGHKPFVRATASDDTGVMTLMFFNSPHAGDRLHVGESFVFYGRAQRAGRRVTMVNPVVDAQNAPDAAGGTGGNAQTGRLMPVYPLTAGLAQGTMRRAVREALPCAGALADLLPEAVRVRYELMDYAEAVRCIHCPEDERQLERARRRLSFEELFLLALILMQRRSGNRTASGEALRPCSLEPVYDSLPYTLTRAQRRVIGEALADMERGSPAMHRLVQGDVGSGKTAVAMACAYAAAKSGWQTALMAPTEILAEQHFRTLQAQLEPLGVRTALLTGGMGTAARREALGRIALGDVQLVIGTHALFSGDVRYSRLRLVITDEQHRFGVEQRARLAAKAEGTQGEVPHVLVMSATPIPRTLALVLYGDLDVSALDELPPGRTPVQTRVLSGKSRLRAYGFMQSRFALGHQGYVVCPGIEDNPDGAPMETVESVTEKLRALFPGYRVDCVHGRMKPAEKERVMRAFAAGEITLLVATTVIEVGVNVPNATVMLIENAERFGLAQLHQLRGRVGRGDAESYCILISDAGGADTRARLEALCRTNDGFELAQEDLRLRGPGDFLGVRQSGLPGLHTAAFGTDLSLFADAQDAARLIRISDPELRDYPELRAYTERVLREAAGRLE